MAVHWPSMHASCWHKWLICLSWGEAEKEKFADDDRSFSSDDGADGQDESRYRITLPLDVRLAPPTPLFATAAVPAMPLPHRSLPISHPPLLASLPAPPSLPTVHTQLAVEQSVRPLMNIDTRLPALMSMRPVNIVDHPLTSLLPPPPPPLQQQQLMLPASTPVQFVHPPRCRDYDGECVSVNVSVCFVFLQRVIACVCVCMCGLRMWCVPNPNPTEFRIFLKSEIRLILKIRSQQIYGFRSCCFSPIYLLFIQLFS